MIQADVFLHMTDVPCEFRLQRISDGMFFGGTRDNGEVCFCEDWNDVPYYQSVLMLDNDDATLEYQWNWQIDECEFDMSTLRMEDFRVHIVVGESGN